jgi:cytochrome c-type biogenesis protein CcmH
MPTFIAIAGAFVVAVAFLVLYPLWRQARWATLAIGGVFVLTAAGLYARMGTPAALDAINVERPATLPDAVAQLEAALARDPSQVEGWRLLGHAYASEQKLDKSRDAYARAAKLAPDQPDILVEAAEASALANPTRRFDSPAVAMLRRALEVQSNHQRARWFLGIAQYQSGQAAEAAKTWEPLLAQVDAPTAVPLRAEINVARKEAGLPVLPAPVATANAALRVTVALDPQLASRIRLNGAASVFVIARRPNGPPMPVAVEKHAVQELPFAATLDDSDGPMPTQRLSTQAQVEVIARLSMSGNAIPQAGDIESTPVLVRLPADGIVHLTLGMAHQ